MKLLFKALVCLSILPLGVFSQGKIQKFMTGPSNDQTRIVLAFIEMTEANYKMESMIIDFDPIKDGKEKPKSVTVDLTATVRSLSARKKDQKVLLIRWNENDEIEMKCDGKWTKKESDSSARKIIETTKSIIQNVPLNSKEETEFTLPDEIVKKIESVLESMKTENFSCLRIIN